MINFNETKTAESLIVNFIDTDGGWITFELKIGDQVFSNRFTVVYDPILNFKNWLEALAVGVQQASFRFENEGTELTFDFQRISYETDFFIIHENFEGGRTFLKAKTDRKQLVKAFYEGFNAFYKSKKYKKVEWEGESLKDKLLKNSGIEFTDLKRKVNSFNRKELEEVLSCLAPLNSFTPKQEVEAANFVKNMISGEVTDFQAPPTNKITYWRIPANYDTMAEEERINFINNYMQRNVGDYSGTKLNEFSSEIIENYIYQ